MLLKRNWIASFSGYSEAYGLTGGGGFRLLILEVEDNYNKEYTRGINHSNKIVFQLV